MSEPTNAWAALVRAALVGAERMPPLDSLPAVAADIAIAEDDHAMRLLAQASVISVLVRAGQVPPTSDARPSPCRVDGLRPAGPLATQALTTILADQPRLLAEWCTAAARGKRRVPDHVLPAFLDQLAKETTAPALEAMRTVLGERGTWLAQQNPAWSAVPGAAEEAADLVWTTGSKADRMQALLQRRRDDPAAGRNLLMATAATEPPEDLAQFVAVLEERLSMQDHDFLESLLDAKNKPVRVAAARLLGKLPDSARSQRNIRRIGARLIFERTAGGFLKRGKSLLKVTLPEADDPAETKSFTRDGIDTAKKRGTLGPKAVALLQTIAGTPLAHFTTAWDATPAEVLDAALDTEWAEALILGFSEAAYEQRDVIWIEALIERFTGRAGGLLARLNMGFGELYQLLPVPRQEALLAEVISKRPRAIHDSWVIDVLSAMAHDWSPAFTQTFLATVKSHYLYEQHWALRALLPRLAQHMHPDSATDIAEGWPETSRQWTDGDRQMLGAIGATLSLRRNFIKELLS